MANFSIKLPPNATPQEKDRFRKLRQTQGETDTNETSSNTNSAAIAFNTTHRASDGKDHSDVVLNNAKETDVNHNVTTNLSEGANTETTVDVNSSDGTNATLVSATTARAGLLTSDKWDEIVANTNRYINIDGGSAGSVFGGIPISPLDGGSAGSF